MEELEGDGGGALNELRERVEESEEGVQGAAYEKTNMREEDGITSSRSEDHLVFRDQDPKFELSVAASGDQKLMEPDEISISQDHPSESMDGKMEDTSMLTPEKLEPEFVSSREDLVPSNKDSHLEGSLRDHEATPDDTPNRQESIECRSFLEGDDCSESAPMDNLSEKSTSVKNYSTVDDEGATPQFGVEKKEVLGKESEDVVMEIAQRLSQLRSIGKTAESARKYILESDTGVEDLDSNDHMSDLLGPKRLDFEIIDFDQFGAQPPDLPLNNKLMEVNHHHGGISTSNGGKRAKIKEPEHHHGRVSNAHNGFEQEMKGLHDSPVKISSKNSPEKKQLQKERHGSGALDSLASHVIPRLCNMVHGKEGSRGQEVSKDVDSNFIAGRPGNPKLRLMDSVKTKKTGEAPSGSPIRRSKSTMPDVKGSPVHEETRKRTEDLQQLTHMQAKRLEDCCKRVDSLTAQLQEQSRLHEELNREHEAECDERLKSEAQSMVLCELLPSVEDKLKHLCDQMLFMEIQLQEQVDLRSKLEEALGRERQERIHLVATLEELRNKLEDGLEQEHQERMHFAGIVEEQVDLRDKLEDDLQQERQESMHLAATLEAQVDLRSKFEEELVQERKARTIYVAQLEEHIRLHEELEGDLQQERQERMHLAAKLEEQADLRSKFEEDLVLEHKARTQYAAQLKEQIRLHEELVYKLEQERDERLKSEADLIVLHEILPTLETKLEDLNNQVQSLVGQLQEQTELSEELKQKLDQEHEERTHLMAKLEHQTKIHEELSRKFKEEQLKSGENLKQLQKRLPKDENKLKDLQNQLLSLTAQLQNQIELRKELEARLDQEREERIESALTMANYQTGETLPVSSIPSSEETIEFAKLLDEQKKLLSNQVKEAELLKTATEKKAGLLDHQVRNLEVLSELVETMECAFSAKERAFRQTMWTVFQALCLGMGLVNFIVSCRRPLQSSLQPT